MDSRSRMRLRSVPCRFGTESAQKMSYWCRKCAKQRQLSAPCDRISRRVAAAQAWAGWRVSSSCGWAARRTAGWYIACWLRLRPERCALGPGFGRSVRSWSTCSVRSRDLVRIPAATSVDMFAAWAWWSGICVYALRSGPAWLCLGSTLQYSTFRKLLQGTAGPDFDNAVDSGQWSVASGQWPGTAGTG